MSKRDSSVRDDKHKEEPTNRLSWWLLLEGDRIVITGGAVVAVFLLTMVLVRLNAIAVGPNSSMGTVFSSVIAGLLTLITVTLTINQLILSRVFGSPQELSDQLEGNRQFRRSVEDLTGRRSTPNEPADFVSLIGETLYERTTHLQDVVDDSGGEVPDRFGQLSDIVAQADNLRELDAEEMQSGEVLQTLLGPRYARSLTTVDYLRDTYADRLPEEAQNDLDAVSSLLEAVAVARQYYKTLALQQALAQLSRYIAYVGSISLLVAFYVALTYRSGGSTAVDPQYLPWIASAGVAIGISPLAVLLTHVLRIATISRYTLSVGPFVPPKEQIRER